MSPAHRGVRRDCGFSVDGGRKRRAAGIEARDQRAEIDRRLQLAPREPARLAALVGNHAWGQLAQRIELANRAIVGRVDRT